MNNPTLDLTVPEEQLSLFFPPLRQGVGIAARSGQTVHAFLHQDLGLSLKIIQSRVQTVFLNGQPADELNTARLAAGDVLTLSAAMPGLLGACMRVDSPYAAMRDSLSQDRAEQQWNQAKGETIRFTLKLFNFMAAEVGPYVCKQGMILDKDRVLDLLETSTVQALRADGAQLILDGRPLNPVQESLSALLDQVDTVFLRIVCEQ